MYRYVWLFIVIRLLLLGSCEEIRPLYFGTKYGITEAGCFTCELEPSSWIDYSQLNSHFDLIITQNGSINNVCFDGTFDYNYFNIKCKNFTYFLYSGTTDRLLNVVGNHSLYSEDFTTPLHIPCYAVYPNVSVEILNEHDYTPVRGRIEQREYGYTIYTNTTTLKTGDIIVVRGSLKNESGQVIKTQETRYKLFLSGVKVFHQSPKDMVVVEGTDVRITVTFLLEKGWSSQVSWLGKLEKNILRDIKVISTEMWNGVMYEKHSAQLIIKKVKKNESGFYCLVIPEVSYIFKLKVLPKAFKITANDVFHINDKEAKLEVEYDADPAPVITWYDQHDNKIQISNKYIIESTDKHTRLLINNLQIQDNGDYTVKLSITNVTTSVTIPLTVAGVQDVTITSNKYIPIDTQFDNVTCQVYSNPRPQFTWTYFDREIKILQNYTVEEIEPNHYLSRLWYEPVDLLVTLTCKTDNEHDSKQAVENIYKTNFKNGFDISSSKEKPYVGDDVNLTCYTDIYSYSHFINWTLPSDEIMFNVVKLSNSTYC